MRNDDTTDNSSVRVPGRPQAGLQAPTRSSSSHNDAAANVTRSHIEKIYNDDPVHTAHHVTPAAGQPVEATPEQSEPRTAHADAPTQSFEPENPYERTHSDDNLQSNAEDWQQYHSAWQQYYQQYFYRYYAGHLQQSHTELERHKQKIAELNTRHATSPAINATPDDAQSRDEALKDIRSQLRGKVSHTAEKARKSRHFLPIMAASAVMLVFLFLQYNRVLLANVEAYISPGAISPSNIIVDPNLSLSVSSEPRLIIPKINVDVPVIWNAKPSHSSQMAAMAKGVAYFGIPGANAMPGQVGNTVLSGHSSSDWLNDGDYKFIFARLPQMQKDDTVYINYEGTRYTYKITKKEVVEPTDVGALVYETNKPMLTLITCVPIGTADDRLLVTAEQISPDPAKAKPAPDSSTSGDKKAIIPGETESFLGRIFGGE